MRTSAPRQVAGVAGTIEAVPVMSSSWVCMSISPLAAGVLMETWGAVTVNESIRIFDNWPSQLVNRTSRVSPVASAAIFIVAWICEELMYVQEENVTPVPKETVGLVEPQIWKLEPFIVIVLWAVWPPDVGLIVVITGARTVNVSLEGLDERASGLLTTIL